MEREGGLTTEQRDELREEMQNTDFVVDEVSKEISKNLAEHGLAFMDASHNIYPPAAKVALVRAWLEQRNLKGAADSVGIPYNAALKFKQRAPWWGRVEQTLISILHQDSMNILGRVVIHGTEKMIDLITNGTEFVDKAGAKKKRSISPKELAELMKVAVEAQIAAKKLEQAKMEQSEEKPRLPDMAVLQGEFSRVIGDGE